MFQTLGNRSSFVNLKLVLFDFKFVSDFAFRISDFVLLVSKVVLLNNQSYESVGGRMHKGKKIIAIGERDGVPGPVIAECLEAAGYEVIFQATECFV